MYIINLFKRKQRLGLGLSKSINTLSTQDHTSVVP